MAKDNFGKWQGGSNFVFAPQWASGKSNDGNYKKKFGAAATRRRGRFNSNPTECAHVSCQIKARSSADKAAFLASGRPVKTSHKGVSVNNKV